MSKILAKLFVVLLVAAGSAYAQTPTGAISGVVTDPAGARVAGARVSIINRDSGLRRNLITSTEGDYSAAALPSGVYSVTAEATGFSLVERTATVEVGTTTTVNLTLQVGDVRETVTVENVAPLINYEQHQVGGVVSRKQIENLPLNGRNFLELAKLEPGVTNPVRGTNNRVFVPTLGAGLQNSPRIGFTRVTVDGGDINLVGTIGAALQVSQEVVQEFQISTLNFDLSTSVTTNGAINIVTRSGATTFTAADSTFIETTTWPLILDCGATPAIRTRSFGGSSLAINSAGPFAKTAPSSSPATSAMTSEGCFQSNHALWSLLHWEESSPVLISATSSTCASTCASTPTTTLSPATRTMAIMPSPPSTAVTMLCPLVGPASRIG